ncbi:DUF1294 domain-containing protein [Peribacillus huizhouensis]|uniref:Uncharacterized membrane protein YsdA (DUF1294 family) n=1 Tax=Peribacillus huizhouensis TaxID=1501239 RepID=A0ABR6CLB6_9BACI|nr:DUF1294 domain-containing protein [Peribacillus huizhouensis]MBA9025837.1 uncharacterized membrane protein YsdA (DUF1294 family) [Peribacillus huizhouensis]
MGIALLIIYLLAINVAAYTTMGSDKKKARNHEYRISERTLWLLAFFGGATGGYIGMKHFRHKTNHVSFKRGFPILMIIQLWMIAYWILR